VLASENDETRARNSASCWIEELSRVRDNYLAAANAAAASPASRLGAWPAIRRRS
jgi:hypothetical protein